MNNTALIAEAVLSHPEVETGFVQETHNLDKRRVVRVPGGAGAWIHGQSEHTTYRVWIRSEKSFGEAEGSDLKAAVREAFEKAKLTPPVIE